MNRSGECVRSFTDYFKIPRENLLVLHDDIDLEVGRIKYKFAGGSGGHNGLNSIDRALGKDYHRIRIGVGRPRTNFDVSDYVLNPFSKDEYEIVSSSVQTIVSYFHLLPAGHVEEFQHNVCGKISS